MKQHRRLPSNSLLALLALLAFGATASAQRPLLELVSTEAALMIAADTRGAGPEGLVRDLTALGWESAAETIERISTALGTDEVAEVLPLLFPSRRPGATGPLASAVVSLCPELETPLRALTPGGAILPPLEALLSLETGDGEPAMTLLLRLSEASSAQMGMLRLALRGCAGETVAIEPESGDGGTTELLIFGDGGETIYLVLGADGLLVASNDQGTAVASAQRAGLPAGAEGQPGALASLAGRFEAGPPFLRLAADPRALLELAGPLADMAVDALEPGDTPPDLLTARLADAADTIDSVGLQLSANETGLVEEWAISIDPERPDPALADLLLCRDCRPARPFLAPAGSFAVASARLPLSEIVDYASSWAADAGAGDLREMFRQLTGIDLEADLLSWLGDQIHLVTLEPLSSDLRTILYQQGQVALIPVASQAEAEAGLERLEGILLDHLDANGGRLGGEYAVALRHQSYSDVPYLRIQTLVTVDLGVALIGNHLAIALPSAALEPVIDTFQGAPSIVSDERFRQASAAAPEGARVSFQDTGAQLRALADIARLVGQPLAFVIDMSIGDAASDEEFLTAGWFTSLEGVEAQPLEPGAHEGTLSDGSEAGETGDQYLDAELSDIYLLTGLEPGARVTAVVESLEFDTALYLIDRTDEFVLHYNDDAPDTTRSELVFTVEEGAEYLLQVTSFGGSETGDYRLQVESEEAAEPVELPEFARLLELTELPAQLLDVLAAHLGTTVGYTVSDGNVVYATWSYSPSP